MINNINLDDICYKRSCLSQVIIRLDFLEYIEANVLFGSDVEKEILNYFSKKGMQQIIRFQTMNVISEPKFTRSEQTTREGVQQEFTSADGDKIIISNMFVIIEINNYTKFEDVLNMFVPMLKVLLQKKNLTAMRTGIRYINFFCDDRIKPQKRFFTQSVGSLLDVKQGSNNCVRSMAMNEYVVGDMRLNFRFGMYNPQYPQLMSKPNYVLDYDCFCDVALAGFDEMIKHIKSGHDSIQKMFENSITDHLRKVMNNG